MLEKYIIVNACYLFDIGTVPIVIGFAQNTRGPMPKFFKILKLVMLRGTNFN